MFFKIKSDDAFKSECCYFQVSKTPGGRLVFLYRKKLGSVPRCGDTGVKLKGVCLLALFIRFMS